jgi:MoaE-MoaD fusion protein
MQVHLLFFGMLKDLPGATDGALDLPESATVSDLLEQCQRKIPQLRNLLPSLAVALNQQYADPQAKLHAGDEVALLPPVSGGSGGTKQAGDFSPGSCSVPLRSPRCAIVGERVDTQKFVDRLKCGEDGAVIVFEGIVRNQTRGRKTLYLDYEAYEEMALGQMEELVEQALRQFQIRDAEIVHRRGRLDIGETSVLIIVASAHRAAAFEACRWLIDTLKKTVPIWKKEYFEDGAVWADGEPFPPEIARGNPPS